MNKSARRVRLIWWNAPSLWRCGSFRDGYVRMLECKGGCRTKAVAATARKLAMHFFQLMVRRYENASTVLTSDKGLRELGRDLR